MTRLLVSDALYFHIVIVKNFSCKSILNVYIERISLEANEISYLNYDDATCENLKILQT